MKEYEIKELKKENFIQKYKNIDFYIINMEKLRMSQLRNEQIKECKKKDGKYFILLKYDNTWYELIEDILCQDASGGPLMAYLNSICEKNE
ncbi:MAG: hypothetical protein WC393_00380 [Candidatus Nanoarchaeia archaeon]|jgi:hypothetical protein